MATSTISRHFHRERLLEQTAEESKGSSSEELPLYVCLPDNNLPVTSSSGYERRAESMDSNVDVSVDICIES